MLKLYNTLTRRKEIFKPLKSKKAGIYSCGPTVYWYQHIGNLRSYIFSDILKKVLAYDGYQVKHVINVTDVGHLTSDADEGEDKMEKAAKKEGKNAKEIAKHYFQSFREDFRRLNISEPDVWPKATDHIKEQIEIIKKLEKKGYTYITNDGVYFNTEKFKNYGKLAKLKKEGLEAGKRISLKEKKSPTDFALWKFSEKPGLRQQEWQSPWGLGFPGWHIECSAMSMKYLGPHFDIHTGGEDHIPIHHTNEIAQSEAASGKKFVNYWLHGSFLTFKGEKVSKSKGGLFTVSQLEKEGFLSLSYRYLVLSAHYRSTLEFTLESLKNAQNSYKKLKNIVADLKDDGKTNKKYMKEFETAINNDLDTPSALATLWKLLRDKKAVGKLAAAKEMDKVFSLSLFIKEKTEIPNEIKKMVKNREEVRKIKQWQEADKIRKEIEKQGYSVKDTKEGPKIERL
jgi:cysteinyl-tRNA synthetase